MKAKKSTYERYRLASNRLDHLIIFLNNPAQRVDTIRLDGKRYRLVKLQDGSTNLEEWKEE